MATATCGPLTFICVFVLVLIAASFALGNQENAVRGRQRDLNLRRMRNMNGNEGRRRGNEGVAVDDASANTGGRRGGRRNREGGGRNAGNRGRNRGGEGNGGGRRGGGGGGRNRDRPMFNRRQTNLVALLASANAQFSLEMYNSLKGSNSELIFSPHSIHTALTMTYMGAKDKTAKQMLQVLNLRRLRKDKAHLAYSALTSSLTSASNVSLDVANAVYVKPNFPVEDAFRQGLQNLYSAEFGTFDYAAVGGPEAPINEWVAEKTRDKIQDLLSGGTIDQMTAMIIINAIYFKGNWRDKFEVDATTTQPFYRDERSTVDVPMMSRTGDYNYARSAALNSHVVELYYQGDRFSMVIILPLTRGDLAAVERSMTFNLLDNELRQMRSSRVQLSLPRFKSESKFSLKETLRSMGMDIPFNPSKAQFGGISPTHDLYISDVIHQAVVEVNEEGTEAAAATGVIIGLRSFPRPTTEVKADHPFIYAIRDNLTNTWIFMGKYAAAQ